MIKRFTAFLAILVATFALTNTAQAKSDESFGFETYSKEAFEMAVEAGDKVVVSIWATWCPNCHAQRRTLSGVLGSTSVDYSDVKVFGLEYDAADRPAAIGSHRLGNSGARTTLIFFDNGEEVGVYGGQSNRDMEAFLNVEL